MNEANSPQPSEPKSSKQPSANQAPMTQIDCPDRWQAYFRLCELGVTCRCRSHQPLEVEINTPHTAIQLWSVLAQTSRPRLDLARWLQTCWEL